MEEKTESGGNGYKGLLEFLIHDASYYAFNIWANICVVVLSELSWYQGRKHTKNTYRKYQYIYEKIKSNHLCDSISSLYVCICQYNQQGNLQFEDETSLTEQRPTQRYIYIYRNPPEVFHGPVGLESFLWQRKLIKEKKRVTVRLEIERRKAALFVLCSFHKSQLLSLSGHRHSTE